MLAQNYKTASELGIRDIDQQALIKVLGMLERGEFIHWQTRWARKYIFNMNAPEVHSCGSMGCIVGWAHYLSEGAFTGASKYPNWPVGLKELYYPDESIKEIQDITVPEAAQALRNYLTTGESRWNEVLAGS